MSRELRLTGQALDRMTKGAETDSSNKVPLPKGAYMSILTAQVRPTRKQKIIANKLKKLAAQKAKEALAKTKAAKRAKRAKFAETGRKSKPADDNSDLDDVPLSNRRLIDGNRGNSASDE